MILETQISTKNKAMNSIRLSFRNLLLCTLSALILASSLSSCKKHKTTNIVIIFTDDQGYQDLGCYGAVGFKTPNIDRLAKQGMRFTNFYVSQAVCSASRGSLLTGCYAERIGIQGALMPTSSIGLNPDEETIAELLKGKDYKTGIFGKWHLGHHKEFLPTKHGFDEYLGLPYSNDMWPVDFNGNPDTAQRKKNYPKLPLIKNSEVIDTIETLADQDKLTSLYTYAAVDFINRNKNVPFLLYLPHSMPHVPLGVSEKFRGKSKQGLYGDAVMEIDWSVGEVVKALEKNGLSENTLIIFTSDNGPWKSFGNHAGQTGPLREGKGTMFEGGARVPCIMKWPGRIPEGIVCNELASTIDILPTIADIAQTKLPEKKIDGVNILPLITGNKKESPRNELFYYYGGGLDAVRKNNWKLMLPHRSRSYQGVEPGNDGHPGPYAFINVEKALYNLEDDLGETTNLIDQYPEIVKELEAIADSARNMLGDQITGAVGTEMRQPGRLGSENIKSKNHLGKNKTLKVTTAAHPKYCGSTKNGLNDGFVGTTDFNDGSWSGFEYHDLEAIIDLDSIREINSITTNFLCDQEHWIFKPTKVYYYISKDGSNYDMEYSQSTVLESNDHKDIWSAEVSFENTSGRYIKVIAKNIGLCPEWHPGVGGRSWIFCDEIIIN